MTMIRIYTRYELLRTFRATKFFAFTIGLPLLIFLVLAGPNRHEQVQGVPLPVYEMSGMAAWGSMAATLSVGGRIAAERQLGWHRQLRVTPLPQTVYFTAKIVASYALALLTIAFLYVAGTAMGVRLSAGAWLTTTVLLLVGLVPFVSIGVALGHLLSVDSLGPALGGVTAVFALFGGAWGPIAEQGVLVDIVKLLPSYWLVQAGRVAAGGAGWPAEGWLVVAVWSLAAARVAMRVRARDTARA
jgi:ABC-2 type transport system permease protein